MTISASSNTVVRKGSRDTQRSETVCTSRTIRARAEAAYKAGDVYEAIRLYEQALSTESKPEPALQTLGDLYLQVRSYEAAARTYARLADAGLGDERLVEHWVWALLALGRMPEAQEVADRGGHGSLTLALKQDRGGAADVNHLRRIGDHLFRCGQYSACESYYTRLTALIEDATLYAKLGHVYRFTNRFTDAITALEKAVALQPDRGALWVNLDNMRALAGRLDEALDCMQKGVDLEPENPDALSNLLFAAHYHPDWDRPRLTKWHRRWGERFAPVHLARTNHDNTPDPDRRLRIGFIGADFRRHLVACNFEGTLTALDRQALEVFGYGSVAYPDEVTARLQRRFDPYRDIYGHADDEVAKIIARDHIDILLAVAGHSFGHRLRVLAYKPAPIQCDYFGINTTGMSQVDYRFTDVWLDPPENDPCGDVETLVRLPGGILCHQPWEGSPAVSPLPMLKQGYPTFGCFCGSQKCHEGVLALWSKVLRAIPESRMILKCEGGGDPTVVERWQAAFTKQGIEADRINIYGWMSRAEHMALYQQIDIGLDTYPFTGCVTTLEALWMGVPVLSLVGQTHVSRAGLSMLQGVGLGACAATDEATYVTKAVSLAQQPEVLVKIWAGLRRRMAASPICVAAGRARDLEAALRTMWQRWCHQQQGGDRT